MRRKYHEPAWKSSPPKPTVYTATTGEIHPQTRAAIEASGLPWEIVIVQGDTDYHDLIARLWSEQRTFLTVEPDIVPGPGNLAELIACPSEWCGFGYAYPPFGHYFGMGCTKFSSILMRRFPDAMELASQQSDALHPPKHWCRVDGWLKQILLNSGAFMHGHGIVPHHHKGGPAHGCVKGLDENRRPIMATPEEMGLTPLTSRPDPASVLS